MRERIKTKEHRMITLWRIAAALGLLVLLLLYVALPPVHRVVSGWVMALTQRSVLASAGVVGQAGAFAPLKAAWLSAFQTFALPWLTPYSIGGNELALGPVVGGLASFFGTLFGASAWFWLVRLFFGSRIKTPTEHPHALTAWEGFSLVAALNWLSLGMLSLAGAVFGITRVRFTRFLLCAAISELPIVILFAVYSNPYRALLPNVVARILRCLGILLLLAGVVMEVKRRKKDAGGPLQT